MSLHASGVELDAALSIPAAVLCAATREVETVHLIVNAGNQKEKIKLYWINYSDNKLHV